MNIKELIEADGIYTYETNVFGNYVFYGEHVIVRIPHHLLSRHEIIVDSERYDHAINVINILSLQPYTYDIVLFGPMDNLDEFAAYSVTIHDMYTGSLVYTIVNNCGSEKIIGYHETNSCLVNYDNGVYNTYTGVDTKVDPDLPGFVEHYRRIQNRFLNTKPACH